MEKFTYVANNVHRIHIVDTNVSKYTEHYLWIANEISEHWRLGFSLTIEQLRHSICNKFPFFSDMKRSTYCQWVTRSVKRAGFSDRKKSITQKIPADWKNLSLLGAERVRNVLKNANVDYIISADETFLRFH